MKYKVGDRVKIKSLDWYNDNKNQLGRVNCGSKSYTIEMCFFCGKILTIQAIGLDFYLMEEDNLGYEFTDEMIEGLAQEYPKIAIQGDPAKGVSVIDALVALGGENEKDVIASTKHACYFIDHDGKIRSRLLENIPEGFKLYTLDQWEKQIAGKIKVGDVFYSKYLKDKPAVDAKEVQKVLEEINDMEKNELLLGVVKTAKGQELIPHKDYEIKQDGDKFYLVKKKKEYPKTFEECCKILGLLNVDLCFNADYRSFNASKEQWKRLGLMNQFYQLLICRDAYWKLYGEEMGLGKPWEPDWNDDTTHKFIVHAIKDEIRCGVSLVKNHIFSFPTEEMRDAFKENFKELIEQCKELL